MEAADRTRCFISFKYILCFVVLLSNPLSLYLHLCELLLLLLLLLESPERLLLLLPLSLQLLLSLGLLLSPLLLL